MLFRSGNLRTYLFRLRVFKNDLLYDTKNNTIQKFNIGSIVNKKLELKHIYDFSYNEIYADYYQIRKSIVEEFNIKGYQNKNKNAIPFEKVNKPELIGYCLENLMDVRDIGRYGKTIVSLLSQEKELNGFIEKMQFINCIVNWNCTPPTGPSSPRRNPSTSSFSGVR